jgi:CubicO group peptidase (beta-lactamase class C family)
VWGGHQDVDRTIPWERDTIVNVFSTTKTMTALCALILADRGELDFHAPVARYWPEFAEAGKGEVEVRHLLGHTAGLSGWEEPLALEQLADWELCTSRLAAQAPWWAPGTESGYHAVTQGYLVGEVIRRITGTSLGRFFKVMIADPLGADFHIGLPPAADARVAPLIPPPPADLRAAGLPELRVRTLANPVITGEVTAQRWWQRAEIPAANGHGNARSVASIQSIVAGGGQSRGTRLLSEAGVAAIFEEQSNGRDLVLGVPLRFGMGFGLASKTMPMGPRSCAWGGYGGSLVFSDLDARVTVAYVMNRMEAGLIGDQRGAGIVTAAVLALATS